MEHRLELVVLACATLNSCAPLDVARCDEPDTRSCDRPASTEGALGVRRLRERNPRYPEGMAVSIRAVSITAIDDYDETMTGRTGTIWAQELSPPGDTADRFAPCPLLPDRSARVCAISMFSPSFSPAGYRPVRGDLVNIVGGGYSEFTCAPCGTPFNDGEFLPQVSQPALQRAGVAPSQPAVRVTLDELLAHYRELMGVLVSVEDVTAMSDPDPRFGEIIIAGPARTGLSLAPQLTPLPNARGGTRWDRITGVVTYFYNPKLLPRSPDDLVGQREPVQM